MSTTKTIKIDPEAHADAWGKARLVGMSLHRFIELAIRVFDPAAHFNGITQQTKKKSAPPKG